MSIFFFGFFLFLILISITFTDEIMEAQLPSEWKGPSIKLHDGSTDLDEHMNVYKK